jgi:hypothetical protein
MAWARSALFQMSGLSSSRFSSSSFAALASKSKIPPQFGAAPGEIGELIGDGVEAFGFHDGGLAKAADYTRDRCRRLPNSGGQAPRSERLFSLLQDFHRRR